MTAQIGDKIIFEGTEYIMASEPSLSSMVLDRYEIRFIAGCTACWRGYVAEWEIADNKLFLNKVSGTAEVTDLLKLRQEKLRLRTLLRKGEITPKQNGEMLRGIRKELTEQKEIDLQFLFGSSEPVFAGWITGKLRIPRGGMLKYVHMDYMTVFEEDLFLEISNGILLHTHIVKNSV